MNLEWHHHLCEYYGVTPEKALELGSRAPNRKPDLPGSKTCNPVSEMTYEDIWGLSERNSVEDVFQFYKDQGAWSAFRQVVRHKDMIGLHCAYLNFLIENGAIFSGSHMCEYGAGVAPFTTSFLLNLEEESAKRMKMKFTIVDVECEHLNFAKYRLNSIKEMRNMENIELCFETVKPDTLPSFSSKIDAILCFEVLEHVPSPVSVLENFKNNTSDNAYYVENFIKHEIDDDEDAGPDLESARKEREQYYEDLKNSFSLIHPNNLSALETHPNQTRIWKKV